MCTLTVLIAYRDRNTRGSLSVLSLTLSHPTPHHFSHTTQRLTPCNPTPHHRHTTLRIRRHRIQQRTQPLHGPRVCLTNTQLNR